MSPFSLTEVGWAVPTLEQGCQGQGPGRASPSSWAWGPALAPRMLLPTPSGTSAAPKKCTASDPGKAKASGPARPRAGGQARR